MDKMSVLKPAAKNPRLTQNPVPVTRTESVDLRTSLEAAATTPLQLSEEERNRRIGTPQASGEEVKKRETHPKGHRVHTTAEVWASMDNQPFLRVSDTALLNDVWCIPTSVESSTSLYANVQLLQILVAPNMKTRYVQTKMAIDDVMKMLYLTDLTFWRMQGAEVLSYEDWINDKTSVCIKAKGVSVGSNRAELCNFIISEDPNFSFVPAFLNGTVAMCFRKITYHSYKFAVPGAGLKYKNPGMEKSTGSKSKFDYIIEARLLPVPEGIFGTNTEEQK